VPGVAMKQNDIKKKGQKGKQFTVIRDFGGNLTAEEYVTRLAKLYENKENHRNQLSFPARRLL
jgi:hypothetical protein